MEKFMRPAGSKKIKVAGLILIISLLIDDIPAVKLQSTVSSFGQDSQNDALDQEALDVMAFTENLTADKNKIKTQEEQNKKRVVQEKSNAEELRMSEDQAVAAYQSQVMAQNEIPEEDKTEEKPKKTVKKKAPAKKVEKQEKDEDEVKEEVVEEKAADVPDSTTVVSNGQELTSTVDVSSITKDAEKTVKKKVIKKAKNKKSDDDEDDSEQKPEKSKKDKSSDDLPEADIDMTNIEQKSDNVKNSEAKQQVDEAQAAIDAQPEEREEKTGLEQIAENYDKAQKEEKKQQKMSQKTKKVETPKESSTDLEPALGEVIAQKENLENDYKKAVKEEEQQQKKKKEKQAEDELNQSAWGQMDTTLQFSKALLTKAQGFEEPDPVVTLECEKVEKPPPKVLTKEEIEQKEQEKMKLFSEFVAADAEANTPVIKKKEVKLEDQPLHFKYYTNDGEGGENQVTDELTDKILGAQSEQINKNKKVLPYSSSDPETGVTPLKAVDYSKSQLNVNNLMEPLHNQDLAEIEESEKESQKTKQATQSKTKDEPIIELTTS